MRMVPVLIETRQHVLASTSSRHHLELLFDFITVSGDWNDNLNASQFKYVIRKLMVRCGVVKPCDGGKTRVPAMEEVCPLQMFHRRAHGSLSQTVAAERTAGIHRTGGSDEVFDGVSQQLTILKCNRRTKQFFSKDIIMPNVPSLVGFCVTFLSLSQAASCISI